MSGARHGHGGHGLDDSDDYGGGLQNTTARERFTASYEKGEVVAHLGVLGDDLEHTGEEGVDVVDVEEEDSRGGRRRLRDDSRCLAPICE